MDLRPFTIFLMFFLLSCSDNNEQDVEDCAGVVGGDAVCGCTDSQATNYNSDATFDDGSCEYDGNLDCAGVLDGDNICGCMDETAITIMLRLLLMMEPVNIILDKWMWSGLKILK